MSFQSLRISTVKARAQKRCVWCGEWIPPGEIHTHESAVTDGDFSASRFHIECRAAYERAPWNDWEYFDPGQFKRGTLEER